MSDKPKRNLATSPYISLEDEHAVRKDLESTGKPLSIETADEYVRDGKQIEARVIRNLLARKQRGIKREHGVKEPFELTDYSPTEDDAVDEALKSVGKFKTPEQKIKDKIEATRLRGDSGAVSRLAEDLRNLTVGSKDRQEKLELTFKTVQKKKQAPGE